MSFVTNCPNVFLYEQNELIQMKHKCKFPTRMLGEYLLKKQLIDVHKKTSISL